MASTEAEKAARDLEEDELRKLSAYALRSKERRESLGSDFREHRDRTPLEYRTEYHRDRDRIVWSRAFKRLQHKTQVFPHYVEDHYRRRLTHALEVAQIATTVARALKLNEVATEAIALGHDLGHTPFGHAGERALNEVLKDTRTKCSCGSTEHPVPIFGFDHCVHGVEVVSRIEREYRSRNGGYYGLNLTFDVRDGILKHMFDRQLDPERPFSTVEQVTAYPAYKDYGQNKGSLEAQCVYFADKVAYLLADIEDGIRRGIFHCDELGHSDFIKQVWRAHVHMRKPRTDKLPMRTIDDFLSYRRKALAALILNCVDTAEKRIKRHSVKSIDDVFACGERIVYVKDQLKDQWTKFHQKWMEGRLFKQKDVRACEFKAVRIVKDLFKAYCSDQDLVDAEYREHLQRSYKKAEICDEEALRLIAARNYIAGMTDPFAINQHARLFMSSERITFS